MAYSIYIKIGNISEDIVLGILKTFSSIQDPALDLNMSALDILYTSKVTGEKKGLQVKYLGRKYKDEADGGYRIAHIDKYKENTLIVCVNEEKKWGLAYLSTANDQEYANLYPGTNNDILSSQIKPWNEFLQILETLLHRTYDLTEEIYLSLISPQNKQEMYSRNRIKIFCDKFGLTYSQVRDSSSPTDIIIEGYNVQIKYLQDPRFISDRGYDYSYNFTRANDEPYSKGMNTLYLFEQGKSPGFFLILHENVLIDLGYIKTDYQAGRTKLHIHEFYHDDEIKNNLTTTQSLYRYRHKWTCNPLFWWSVEHGHIVDLFVGDTLEKGVTSLKNKFIDYCNLFNDRCLLDSIKSSFQNTSYNAKELAMDLFVEYCKCKNIVYTNNNGTILLNNYLAKFYYADKPTDPLKYDYSYRFTLASNQNSIYIGNSTYYIFAIGGYKGKFMILHEETMIHYGLLTIQSIIGKKFLLVYPYDHREIRPTCRGNWTSEKIYWYSI